jgi:tripartite-type tricarboxylate transporter receptor subunit TctC
VLKEIGYSANDVEPVMVLESLDLYLAFSSKTSLSTIRQWEDALRQMKKMAASRRSTRNGFRMNLCLLKSPEKG